MIHRLTRNGLAALSVVLLSSAADARDPYAHSGPYPQENCFRQNSASEPEWLRQMHPARARYYKTLRNAEHFRRLDADRSIEERQPCLCIGSTVAWSEVPELVPREHRDIDVNLLFDPRMQASAFIKSRVNAPERFRVQHNLLCSKR